MVLKNPVIDLLPISRPFENPNDQPSPKYFYDNVVSKLVGDVIRMQYNGIPIDLNKVKKVEDTVNEVLEDVDNTLTNNKLIKRFLEYKANQNCKSKSVELHAKHKSSTDFLSEFKPNNKVHVSYYINTILEDIDNSMCMDTWTKKDLKKLNSIISNPLLESAIKNIYNNDIADKAMHRLAEDKAKIYNKGLKDKYNEFCTSEQNLKFNPGSSQQKAEFFTFLGIESENLTKAGAQQWDRKSLENLQTLLKEMVNDS